MKIALAILYAQPARGGAERYTVDLAHALAQSGEDVTILSGDCSQILPPVKCVYIGARGATRLGRYEHYLRNLSYHLSKHAYDVVHAMLPVTQCDVYHPHAGIAADAVERGGLQHRSGPRRAAARLASQLNIKRRRFAEVERGLVTGEKPPLILSLSGYVSESVLRHYPLAEKWVAPLFNAIDLEKFDPAARPSTADEVRKEFDIPIGHAIALIIAQDFARKGLAEAIEALAQSKKSDVTLVVIGKQKVNRYRKRADRLGVAGRVVFAGTTTDPCKFYRAANVFVLPTRHDPCSLATLEALAMGVPVVSTECNGACEIMVDRIHGRVLSDPADVTALTGAVDYVLNANSHGAMAAACLALRPRLAYQRHLHDLLDIYRRAVDARTHDDAPRRVAP